MNNIEKLAIEHRLIGSETVCDGSIRATYLKRIEAFAKALQSSEPVAKPLRNEHGSLIYDGKGNVIYEKTNHPPASVPLEKYNKLLEILKQAKIVIDITWNSSHANRCDAVLDAINQAIAEAEGK